MITQHRGKLLLARAQAAADARYEQIVTEVENVIREAKETARDLQRQLQAGNNIDLEARSQRQQDMRDLQRTVRGAAQSSCAATPHGNIASASKAVSATSKARDPPLLIVARDRAARSLQMILRSMVSLPLCMCLRVQCGSACGSGHAKTEKYSVRTHSLSQS